MSAVLVAICLGLTFIASRNTYWILKVFAGFFWWGLAFYWVKLPASTDPSLQTILVVVTIFTGIACFFWSFWQNGKDKNGIENLGKFHLPFMKDSEEGSVTPSRYDRLSTYQRTVDNARRGIRERRIR